MSRASYNGLGDWVDKLMAQSWPTARGFLGNCSSSVTNLGTSVGNGTGSLAAVNVSNTTKSTQVLASVLLQTDSALATATGNYRAGVNVPLIGTYGYVYSFVAYLHTINADSQWSAGIAPSDTTNHDPVNTINCVQIGAGAADTEMYLYTNDGAGAADKLSLASIASAAAHTANIGIRLTVGVPAGGGVVYYRVSNVNTGATMSGTVSSNIIGATTAPNWQFYISNGATAAQAKMAISEMLYWGPV